jgi:selenocysteine lyase/cysteine desulfurase
VIHGPTTLDRRGATVAFNLTDTNGCVVPYGHTEERANRAGISIRGGCFCNPGASEHAFGFPAERARECFTRGVNAGFSVSALAECMPGVPIGALRASLGAPSSKGDVQRLIELVATVAFSR